MGNPKGFCVWFKDYLQEGNLRSGKGNARQRSENIIPELSKDIVDTELKLLPGNLSFPIYTGNQMTDLEDDY